MEFKPTAKTKSYLNLLDYFVTVSYLNKIKAITSTTALKFMIICKPWIYGGLLHHKKYDK